MLPLLITTTATIAATTAAVTAAATAGKSDRVAESSDTVAVSVCLCVYVAESGLTLAMTQYPPGRGNAAGKSEQVAEASDRVVESSLTLSIPLCTPGVEMQVGRATKSLRQATESLNQASLYLSLSAPRVWKCRWEERPSR